ncbi:uncharacterized protein [Pyrus communis]|uniref:uncharacterized protein n=1 Tax=Pyrus communis TaxID=23211 RepID=UPI0035C22F88
MTNVLLPQTINFFNLGSKLCLVDLPGYGFAYAKEEFKDALVELVKEYVSTRVGLKRVCLLTGTKWRMKPRDHELIDLMESLKANKSLVQPAVWSMLLSDQLIITSILLTRISVENNVITPDLVLISGDGELEIWSWYSKFKNSPSEDCPSCQSLICSIRLWRAACTNVLAWKPNFSNS